jgi:hypothetical protein
MLQRLADVRIVTVDDAAGRARVARWLLGPSSPKPTPERRD